MNLRETQKQPPVHLEISLQASTLASVWSADTSKDEHQAGTINVLRRQHAWVQKDASALRATNATNRNSSRSSSNSSSVIFIVVKGFLSSLDEISYRL